jgi:hypothetical protein
MTTPVASCLTNRERQIVSQVVSAFYPTVGLPEALVEVGQRACIGDDKFNAYEVAHVVCSELEAMGGRSCRVCIPFKKKGD